MQLQTSTKADVPSNFPTVEGISLLMLVVTEHYPIEDFPTVASPLQHIHCNALLLLLQDLLPSHYVKKILPEVLFSNSAEGQGQTNKQTNAAHNLFTTSKVMMLLLP